ncbi:MAG: 4-hydroxythreonine-4-phosphate dehydrogenase PdxA [Balneolaceae bacterium]
MKPNIGITLGDCNGIGPEIILKALSGIDCTQSTPIIIGSKSVLEYYKSELSIDLPLYSVSNSKTDTNLDSGFGVYEVVDSASITPTPGDQSPESGLLAMKAIEKAIELCVSEDIHAMVTAPISKEAVNLAGYQIPGHTEFLAEQTKAESVLMILVNNSLRVALVTGHIPILKVAQSITEEVILERLSVLDRSLKEDFLIEKPSIAVLGLNPHAGDGGVIGTEEIEIISPAIKQAQKEGIKATGPFPADGFFGQKLHLKYDAILAMYHDQGLAPFKLLSFGSGVNFTAGLPIIRTSPDHGTAFNIAGKGIADPSSFIEAYNLAVKLAKKKFS